MHRRVIWKHSGIRRLSVERAQAGVSWLGSPRGIDPSVQKGLLRVGAVPCPTLIIHGKKDVVIPAKHSESAARSIQNTRLVVFDDCGHTPQVERPADFNAELAAFMAGLG